MDYCPSVYQSKRWKTREVKVGSVGVGGQNPVRIQSMTTSDTRDVEATSAQVLRLQEAGCEIVRMTVQGMKEALACEGIKNNLVKMGVDIPLVADIHFFPPAAMQVVEFVDKVRINPGNFVDKRATFKVLEYTDQEYREELERIEEKFSPLVEKCKRLNRAMRIGTNHGSLSDRIMNVYGDSPRGMVESALEYARICRKLDYHSFIFSMKASNTQVMIEAYRLLVAEMMKLGWDYPLHLGVTEAGQGEDGRIKSAMGIGSLLLDGIGDTIRVSLTEDPWFEIDPCQRLVQYAKKCLGKGIAPFVEKHRDFTNVEKRPIEYKRGVALHRDGSVLVRLSEQELLADDLFKSLDVSGGLKMGSVDTVVLEKNLSHQVAKERVEKLIEMGVGVLSKEPLRGALSLVSLDSCQPISDRFSITFDRSFAVEVEDEPASWEKLKELKSSLILFRPKGSRLHAARQFFDWLKEEKIDVPVILDFGYTADKEDLIIESAAECGSLLCDRLGDGLLLSGPIPVNDRRVLAFNILQAARMRTIKTEFISCPSCGRTLFDLQSVTKEIHARTSHLPGVKIAIMGCIVNGPGEMADADFGYVGSKPGMIDLWVGRTCVEKNIPFNEAPDRLVDLIKAHGRWIAEPVVDEGVGAVK